MQQSLNPWITRPAPADGAEMATPEAHVPAPAVISEPLRGMVEPDAHSCWEPDRKTAVIMRVLPGESLPADTRPSKRKDQNALITRKTEGIETFPETAAHTEKPPPRRRQLAARAYLPQSAALARLNIGAFCESPS